MEEFKEVFQTYISTELRRAILSKGRNVATISISVKPVPPSLFRDWFQLEGTVTTQLVFKEEDYYKLEVIFGDPAHWVSIPVFFAGESDGYFKVNSSKPIKLKYSEKQFSMTISLTVNRYNEHGVRQF